MIKAPLWETASPGGASQQTAAHTSQRSSCARQGHSRASRLLLLSGLLVLFFTLSVSAAWADTARVIVMFRDGTPTWVQQKLITQSGGTIVMWLPVVNAVVLELPAGPLVGTASSLTNTLGLGSLLPSTLSTVETAYSFLSNRLGLEIEAIEADFHISLPDDSAPKSLVAETAPTPVQGGYRWNLRQISMDQVDQAVQGQGVKIAVLDTGIDASHPRLAGLVVGGYNARAREDITDYMDRNGHGTHVAGIIAAAAGSPLVAQVMRGVAPGAALHAVRVLDANGKGYLSEVINGLIWVYQQRSIKVVNMSLGFYNSSMVLQKIIRKLYDAGVVMVASSGNCDATAASSEGGDSEGGDSEGGDSEGGDSAVSTSPEGCQTQEIKYPAVYWRTIAVGATDVDARVTYYSITGSHVDLVAPGGTRQKSQVVSLTTTVSTGAESTTTGAGGDSQGATSEGGDSEGGDGVIGQSSGLYAVARGTSQAAPHVTGVIALMRSVNPALTPAQVRTILRETAVDLGAPAAAQGAGLIDAARAIERAKSLR